MFAAIGRRIVDALAPAAPPATPSPPSSWDSVTRAQRLALLSRAPAPAQQPPAPVLRTTHPWEFAGQKVGLRVTWSGAGGDIKITHVAPVGIGEPALMVGFCLLCTVVSTALGQGLTLSQIYNLACRELDNVDFGTKPPLDPGDEATALASRLELIEIIDKPTAAMAASLVTP